MLSKEEIVLNYWQNELRANEARRENRKAEKARREELNKPEYTIGIVNDEGQLEVIQAKPVSNTVKLLPEVISFVVFFLLTYAMIEHFFGAYL